MTIHNEYLFYQEKYENIYGKHKTLVLMQVGSFHEAYATETRGGNLSDVSELTNLTVTRKDKSIDRIDEKNPYLMGFPSVALNKYLRILMDNGYTVITIDQVTKPPKPKRGVTGVYSPGTYIQDAITPDANYIMSIYIEDELQPNGTVLMCIGMSVIDLTTGHTTVHEAQSIKGDEKYALDEAHRFYNNYKPKELIINRKECDENRPYIMKKEAILTYLELKSNSYHYFNRNFKEYQKLAYQNSVFKKVYTESTGILSPIEHLDLEKLSYARMSFILLLDFSYKHNEKIINNLNKPEIYNCEKYLILGNNALYQLNVFETDNYESVNTRFISLFHVVNQTSTPMGRRFLREALANPLTDHISINNRYDCINSLMNHKLYDTIESRLKCVVDVERITRKLNLQIINPFEIAGLLTSLHECRLIIGLVNTTDSLKKYIPDNNTLKLLDEFMKECEYRFNINELKKQTLSEITANFFNDGLYADIDNLYSQINDDLTIMNKVCEVLTGLIEDNDKIKQQKGNLKYTPKIHLQKNNKDGYFLSLSKIRSTILQNNLKKLKANGENKIKITNTFYINIDSIEFRDLPSTKVTKINFTELSDKSTNVDSLRENMIDLIKTTYFNLLTDYTSKYSNMFRIISNFVAIIDFFKSGAKVAKMFNYCRPQIHNMDNGFIKCIDLRHPIVERIKTDTEYIPISITLGRTHDHHPNDEHLDGILLYGVNSAGKSTSQKALGLSVIMAQAGLFVPATEFHYSPYNSLFARITGNDNIFKGLSSFVLEMTELKAILQRTTNKTLVIGDEVCRGTEHISGNAIVASMILHLAKIGSNFMFATHLHELIEIDEIKNLNNVKPYHLSVHYDESNDMLIFDRQLKPGSGDKLYGLLVAKYIIRNNDFIKIAQDIKCRLIDEENTILSTRQSKYNSEVYISECELCGKKSNPQNGIYLDTHHINQQKDCVNGFVKDKIHIPKNISANLIILCKECHVAVHQGKKSVKGYINTSKGRVLVK